MLLYAPDILLSQSLASHIISVTSDLLFLSILFIFNVLILHECRENIWKGYCKDRLLRKNTKMFRVFANFFFFFLQKNLITD